MGVLNKVGGLFGGSKKPTKKAIDDDQKRRAGQVQDLNNRIRASLITLKVEDLTHTIPPETLEKYDNIRKGLAKEFDSSPVKRLDITRVEELAAQMAEQLQNAVHKGDTQTITWIFQGLYYCINEGRKDINESDVDKAEDIQEKRERTMEKYATASSVSAQMQHALEEIRTIHTKISRNTDERNKKKSEMDVLINEKPYLITQLQEAGSPETIKSPELLKAATLVTEVYDLNDTIRDLTAMEANLNDKVMKDRESIRMIDVSLSEAGIMMKEEDMDVLRMLQDEAAASLAESAKRSKELQEIIDRHHLIFENWLKNQAEAMTIAARKFQKMRFMEKQDALNKARAEKLRQDLQDTQVELVVNENEVQEEKTLLENE